jgi:subtilisin family serine protease
VPPRKQDKAGERGAVPPRGSALGIDYGSSLGQNLLHNIPALHDLGYDGRGVLVGHFDSGYRLLSHEALTPLDILATHDFVDGDTDPAPPPTAPDSFGAHGITTLSVLAGFRPGQLVGPAYGAQYVLARTENDASETPLEEDNWASAMEWADSLGVDVVSSSIGYSAFDPPHAPWTWQDMNGDTTRITRAADLAAERGILVVAAAGNDGFNNMHNTLLGPADGDSVIAVGGAWIPPGGSEYERYNTSSVGPTTDQPPRIKPDVAALGVSVYAAGTGSTTMYIRATGTSLACPLAAGVAVLLLSAAPSATPMQIRDAMRATASQSSQPDNLMGWGLVDAAAALQRLTSAVQPASFTDIKRRYR